MVGAGMVDAGTGQIDALLFSVGAAAVTTSGLFAVAIWQEATRARTTWFVAFAAGALVSIALLHLLPEAFEATRAAPRFLMIGFAGAYFLNSGVLAFSNTGNGKRPWAVGILPFLAISFHSFVDGMAYAVTFSADFATGVLTVIGLIFHEVPEAIIVFTLLQRAGLPNRLSFAMAFFGAAVTTPAGTLFTGFFVQGLDPTSFGRLFAITAGILLYIGTSHLLPHLDPEPLRRKIPALLLGGSIGIGASLFHDHDSHDHRSPFGAPRIHGEHAGSDRAPPDGGDRADTILTTSNPDKTTP
ncbi:MAG: ZIP family metal transporter [Alphaproteobacteria bacterium]